MAPYAAAAAAAEVEDVRYGIEFDEEEEDEGEDEFAGLLPCVEAWVVVAGILEDCWWCRRA